MLGPEVYHASGRTGLTKIEPAVGTHGQSWVYATKDFVMSAVFVSRAGGDLTCAVGRDPKSGLPYLCERFEGAFDHRYLDKAGAIYQLPSAGFVEGQTQWSEEVVSEGAVEPLAEIQIADAKAYLRNLVHEGRLILKRYPDRLEGIPEDDEDLVRTGILRTRQYGDRNLAQFREYHPGLVPRILEGIRTNRLAP